MFYPLGFEGISCNSVFAIYTFLLVKEVEIYTLFQLPREIRRVLSAKMASYQLKISQKIDLDSF